MATRIQVEGVKDVQELLRQLPVRNERGRHLLMWQALRKLRTPVRREIRGNIPRGRLKRSIRVLVGSRRLPLFRVKGKDYLVPYNAQSGAVTKELDKLPQQSSAEVFRIYRDWLRRNS